VLLLLLLLLLQKPSQSSSQVCCYNLTATPVCDATADGYKCYQKGGVMATGSCTDKLNPCDIGACCTNNNNNNQSL
jgi:hypothetical protein